MCFKGRRHFRNLCHKTAFSHLIRQCNAEADCKRVREERRGREGRGKGKRGREREEYREIVGGRERMRLIY